MIASKCSGVVGKAMARGACFFGSTQQDDANIKTRPFKTNAVNDFSKIAFEPGQKLQFKNGKCLIYKNNRSIMRIAYENLCYWLPISGISTMIYMNPFANVFPAAIPILVIVDLVNYFLVFKMWLNRIKWNQNLVGEIYLFQNGQATQVWFANQMKRKLFGEELKKIYYNSVFVNPDYEKQQILLLNKQQRVFPSSLAEAEKQQSGYAWVKHFSNGQNMLVIPKRPMKMNIQILIQVFKGKIIKYRTK